MFVRGQIFTTFTLFAVRSPLSTKKRFRGKKACRGIVFPSIAPNHLAVKSFYRIIQVFTYLVHNSAHSLKLVFGKTFKCDLFSFCKRVKHLLVQILPFICNGDMSFAAVVVVFLTGNDPLALHIAKCNADSGRFEFCDIYKLQLSKTFILHKRLKNVSVRITHPDLLKFAANILAKQIAGLIYRGYRLIFVYHQ